ncbi:E3 ubiquitin-protein ligase listerin [Mycena sanguinolenta]|uniref:E3 ubiquitin-protein ligase listerin n=1 Tax=Mycena sanguinolenta TaxID=230812 RepID=A0A8H6XJW4_9AGAR|nr:E3 ubiquitin-protein ligase listerin [Mycena sanguinolenta]
MENNAGLPAKTTDDPVSATTHDEGFARYCADDALIWKLYMNRAKETNENLANSFSSNLDPLLLFATLFSAILTAFLVELQKDLQDLPDTTNGLVLADVGQNNPLIRQTWVNRLWSLSLMFSLMSALFASVAKGWVTQLSPVNPGMLWKDASAHSRHVLEVRRWQMKFVIECLPVLVHIAFFLFNAGLVVLLFPNDRLIAIALLALTGASALVYCVSSLGAVFYRDLPFRTPVSEIIYGLWNSSWRYKRFPSDDEVVKAKVLTWLLTQSLDVATVTPAIQAIAGLKSSPAVQNELLNNNSTVGVLLRALSTGLTSNPPDVGILSMSLYAILQMLQAGPRPKDLDGPVNSLVALVRPGGVLSDIWSMPFQVQRIACCVKARIYFFLWDNHNEPEPELFDTTIPILKESARLQGSLWRVLVEIQLLADKKLALLAPLQDATDRDRGYANFVEKVRAATMIGPMQEHEKLETSSTGRFRPAPILNALKTEVTQQQRVYTGMLASLAADGLFRSLLLLSPCEQQIWSLLLLEDEEARRHAIEAVSHFVSDDLSGVFLTRGIHRLIKDLPTLPTRSTPVFDAVMVFLADIVKNSDVTQQIIGKSPLMSTLAHRIRTNNTNMQLARRVFQKLAKHSAPRASITPETIRDFLWGFAAQDSLAEDAMETIVKLMDNVDMWPIMSNPTIIETIHVLMESNNSQVRIFALHVIEVLVQHDKMNWKISEYTMNRLIKMLNDPERIVLKQVLIVISVLVQHGSNVTLEVIQKILNLLDSVWFSAGRTIAILANSGSQNDITQTIESMLVDVGQQKTALTMLSALALPTLAPKCHLLFTPSLKQRVFSVLDQANDLSLRIQALNTITRLAENNDIWVNVVIPSSSLAIIIQMISDEDDYAKESALTLLYHDKFRATAQIVARVLPGIVDQSKNTWWRLHCLALDILSALASHEDFHSMMPNMKMAEEIAKCLGNSKEEGGSKYVDPDGITTIVLEWLEDNDEDIRASAVKLVGALVKGGHLISNQSLVKEMTTLLHDEDWRVRHSALDTIVVLIADVSTVENVFEAVLVKLCDADADVQSAACDAMTDFAEYVASSKREQNLVQGMLRKKLGTESPDDKQLALTALTVIPPLTESVLQRDILERIILMLADSNPDLRMLARKAALRLVEQDSHKISDSQSLFSLSSSERQTALSGKLNLSGKLQDTIARMINNTSSRVRRSGLIHAAALNQYDDTRSAKETTQNVLSLLTDKSGTEQFNTKQITRLLVDPNEDVQELAVHTLIGFFEYGHFRRHISEASCLRDIFQALSVNSAGEHLLSILDQIVKRKITLNASIILLTETLDQVIHASPAARQLYTDVVKALPLATTLIPKTIVNKIFDILEPNEPDPAMLNSVVQIMLSCAKNDEFRDNIMGFIFEGLIAKHLQRLETATAMLTLLTGLAVYDHTKIRLVQMPQIVLQLLSMYNKGIADSDHWYIGIRGLLALGLLA